MNNEMNRIAIVGLGNPMLDISAVVDPSFLVKHNLHPNKAKHVENEELFIEIESSHLDVKQNAGGSIDNACRVAQRLLGTKAGVGYIGCLGKDKNGQILQDAMQSAGVVTYFQKSTKYPTGRCLVLITNVNRSLVTYPGAANKFSIDHLLCDKNWDAIRNAKIVYSGAFFLACSNESLRKVAQFCSLSKNKIFCFNLSATFLCRSPVVEHVKELIQFADLVVGNAEEAETFAEFGLLMEHKDHKLIAKAISMLPKIGLHRRNRCVIITRGKDPCIVVNGKNIDEVKEFSSIPIKEDDIVDTNGAGDAFVGGLLAHMAIEENNVLKVSDEAILSGLQASFQILKASGCNDKLLLDIP